MKKIFTYLIFLFTIISCTKEVEIDIPPTEQQYVVEGYVEQGKAPLVFLSKSHNYFDPFSIENIEEFFVMDAIVEVVSEEEIYTLSLDFDFEKFPPYFYTCDPNLFSGELNKTYQLNIYVDQDTLTSSTSIPNLNPPDSMWFSFEENEDSLGYIKFYYTDPDTIGNCFRILSKRRGIDKNFIPVLGPNREDVIINGQAFEDYIYRGFGDDIEQEELEEENQYYYSLGDTIDVKWLHINREHFLFWYSVQNNNSGGPFQTPSSVISNINGGLGIWGGQAASYFTIIPE